MFCRKITLLLVLLLCLCGCKGEQFDPEMLAQSYTGRDFSAQYIVTTHAGFYTEYRLSCQHQDGVSAVTILEPQSIAGISAVIQEGSQLLQYEEVQLDALLPEIPGYAPMDMLHQLVNDLGKLPPDQYQIRSTELVLEYRDTRTDGTSLLKIITLDKATMDLRSAECYLDDSLILSLQIESLEWHG